MSARRHLLNFFICTLFFAVSTTAGAAVTDFRVLIDSDHSDATGCTVNGMAGVDHVFTTEVDVTETTANVLRTYRQICSGSTLGAEIEVDHDAYAGGFTPASGALVVETRFPTTAFESTDIPDLHLGFVATRGDVTLSALAHADGTPLMFPLRSTRRRAVRSAEGERSIVRAMSSRIVS